MLVNISTVLKVSKNVVAYRACLSGGTVKLFAVKIKLLVGLLIKIVASQLE